MAKKTENEKENKTKDSTGNSGQEGTTKESRFSMKKLIIFIIPIFIIQVVLIYFLVGKFLSQPDYSQPVSADETEHIETENIVQDFSVHVINDIVVNPAGTNATRFLLTTIGLEATSEVVKEELTRKDVQLRDILNTILTGKRLEELVNVEQRASLREEILTEVNALIRSGDVNQVYFSKFIIQ
jgi:flagellar basal body-associated protein FliL